MKKYEIPLYMIVIEQCLLTNIYNLVVNYIADQATGGGPLRFWPVFTPSSTHENIPSYCPDITAKVNHCLPI